MTSKSFNKSYEEVNNIIGNKCWALTANNEEEKRKQRKEDKKEDKREKEIYRHTYLPGFLPHLEKNCSSMLDIQT